MTNKKGPPAWRKHKAEYGPTLPFFQVRYDWMENPRNQQVLKRIILETGDWVNIVAVTPEQKVVVVRQFRFGTAKVSTEIPGGLIDPGEDSKTAAMRELKEETGYTSDKWTYLGSVEANPAFLNNVCHQWLAEDVKQTSDIDLGDGEDITIDTLTLAEIKAEMKVGTFRHSLALLALAHVFDIRSG
ncbi:MAG: NUDIX hydrolase [Chloroflexota bacterium]